MLIERLGKIQRVLIFSVPFFLMGISSFAQSSNICHSYPPRTECESSCDGQCRNFRCSETRVFVQELFGENSIWWRTQRPSLPLYFQIPGDSCYNPNGQVVVRSVPVNYSADNILISSTQIPHNSARMDYPRCYEDPPTSNGIPCVTVPSSCPVGYDPIPTGIYSGKCGRCESGPDMTVVDMDGTAVGSIPGGCIATTTSTTIATPTTTTLTATTTTTSSTTTSTLPPEPTPTCLNSQVRLGGACGNGGHPINWGYICVGLTLANYNWSCASPSGTVVVNCPNYELEEVACEGNSCSGSAFWVVTTTMSGPDSSCDFGGGHGLAGLDGTSCTPGEPNRTGIGGNHAGAASMCTNYLAICTCR